MYVVGAALWEGFCVEPWALNTLSKGQGPAGLSRRPPPHLRVGNRRAALQGPGHGSDDSCRDTGSRSDTGRAEQV